MGDVKFLNGLSEFFKTVDDANSTVIECHSNIDHYQFYQLCLIPAVVLTLLMAATKPRRHKLLTFLFGRPGLVFPMDTLTRSARLSYCCAFGAIGFTVYQIIWNQMYAIDYSGPTVVKILVSVLIYGLVYFPVFTSLALSTAFSHCLGSFYIWMFFAIEVQRVIECEYEANVRAVLMLRALPNLLCHAYLSVAMPFKFCATLRKRKYFTPSLGEDPYRETLEQIKNSYQGQHVTKLLQKPEVTTPPVGLLNIVKSFIGGFLQTWIYHTQGGFRYPSRLASVMFISACVVYVICVELLVIFITQIQYLLDKTQKALDIISEDEHDDLAYQFSSFVYYCLKIFQVSGIVSVCLAAIIVYLNIIHMMSSFRTNLFAMYRGDYTYIPSPNTRSAVALCTASIKYAGFQVAYIIWGFAAVAIVLFIICIVLAGIITTLIIGYDEWLIDFLLNFWPGFVLAIVLFVLQFLLSKFVFLQDNGEHLRLDNRRFYFVFAYFMFFYNIFLGMFSCVLRILKALGVGLIFLARLDNSTLPRKFEFFDPGFSAYQGYIHMEAAHTHPVAIIFIRLLAALSKERKKNTVAEKQLETFSFEVSVEADESIKECSSSSQSERPVNVAARFNWFVTYTLLHNPTVRLYRKGFIQSIKKARLEGLKIPISDKPITDFDLVKTQQERDKMREMEAMRNSPAHSLYNGLASMGSIMGSTKNPGVLSKPSKKRSRKFKMFRKIKKRNACKRLSTVENGSQDFDDYTLKSYVKHDIVEQ